LHLLVKSSRSAFWSFDIWTQTGQTDKIGIITYRWCPSL